MRVTFKTDAPVVRVSFGSGFTREFRREDAPWEMDALAAEWAGPRGADEEPAAYQFRLADHARRLKLLLEGTGLFEISE